MGTWCNEHCMLYTTDEFLKATSETIDVLYVGQLNLNFFLKSNFISHLPKFPQPKINSTRTNRYWHGCVEKPYSEWKANVEVSPSWIWIYTAILIVIVAVWYWPKKQTAQEYRAQKLVHTYIIILCMAKEVRKYSSERYFLL